jgi:hypothetical protein
MIRPHGFILFLFSYQCTMLQVELPPDIHPLPESVNAYVSRPIYYLYAMRRESPPFPPPSLSTPLRSSPTF